MKPFWNILKLLLRVLGAAVKKKIQPQLRWISVHTTLKCCQAWKFSSRYGSTYAIVARPGATSLTEKVGLLEKQGLPSFLFMGVNYSSAAWIYSHLTPYRIRDVQFSDDGFAAILNSSIGPLNLQIVLVDLISIVAIAAAFWVAFWAFHVAVRWRDLIKAGCYAFGCIFPCLVVLRLASEWTADFDPQTHMLFRPKLSIFGSHNEFDGIIASPLMLTSYFRFGLQYGSIFESNILAIVFDIRTAVFCWIVLGLRVVVVPAIFLLSWIWLNTAGNAGLLLNRLPDYTSVNRSMEPTVRRNQRFRVSFGYFDRMPIRDSQLREPLLALLQLNGCHNGEETTQFHQRGSPSVLTAGDIDPKFVYPMRVVRCPDLTRKTELVPQRSRTLMRLVAQGGDKVQVFTNGRITVNGADIAVRLDRSQFILDAFKERASAQIVTWLVPTPAFTNVELRHAYEWFCSVTCEDYLLFESEIPTDTNFWMYDSPYIDGRFLLAQSSRTVGKPFFYAEETTARRLISWLAKTLG